MVWGPVRLHVVFLLAVIVLFGLASQHPQGGPILGGTALVTALVLFFSGYLS